MGIDDRTGTQVIVVTGASAGVGRAIVRALARPGVRLGLVARGRGGLEGARRDVEQRGGEALVLAADVADAERIEAVAAEVEHTLGPIDAWINNAMVSVFSPALATTAADYRRVTEVTYLGYVHGTLAALRRMAPRNRGTIVQVGSALCYRGIPLQSAYCGAKHAVQGFTESLRCELLHDRIRVRITMVHLPALNTPQFAWVKTRLERRPQPVPPIYQPEVAATAVVHALRHHRREWYVGYPTVAAILGNAVAPGLTDRLLATVGYEAQQYDGAVAPDRAHNLDAPVDDARDLGAHGEFDDRARSISVQARLSRHRCWILVALLAATAIALLARR